MCIMWKLLTQYKQLEVLEALVTFLCTDSWDTFLPAQTPWRLLKWGICDGRAVASFASGFFQIKKPPSSERLSKMLLITEGHNFPETEKKEGNSCTWKQASLPKQNTRDYTYNIQLNASTWKLRLLQFLYRQSCYHCNHCPMHSEAKQEETLEFRTEKNLM